MDHFTDEKAVGVSKVLVIEATIGPFSSVLARAETEESGPIVASITNSFLTPTSFSSVK